MVGEIANGVNNRVDGIKGGVDSISSAFGNVNDIGDQFTSVTDDVGQKFKDFGKDVEDRFKDVGNKLEEIFGKL
jgi:hypothetical protein